MRRRMLAVVIASLCLFHQAMAGICIPPLAELDNREKFLHAVIRSLSKLKEARTTVSQLGKVKDAQEFFTTIDLANEALECASRDVDGYKSNKDEGIQVTIEGLQGVAAKLTALNDQVKKNMVAEMNGETKSENPGDKASRMATLGTDYRKTWEVLVVIGAAATAPLVEFNPSTKKAERLAITTVQRNAINRELEKTFPEIIANAKGTLPPVESAAAILHSSINDKKWKLHEQPFSKN